MSAEKMTEERAKQLFDKWVDILQLHEWDIHFFWKVEPHDMEIDNCAGCTVWNEENRQAIIQIRNLENYKPEVGGFDLDYEHVLIHELMELKMSLLSQTDNEVQNRHVHILVDGIARTLVRAARGEPT